MPKLRRVIFTPMPFLQRRTVSGNLTKDTQGSFSTSIAVILAYDAVFHLRMPKRMYPDIDFSQNEVVAISPESVNNSTSRKWQNDLMLILCQMHQRHLNMDDVS